MTCRDCFHFKACSKGSKDGLPRFVGKEIACNNVEDLCDCFEDKSKVENALEKQIPKKPLDVEPQWCICPDCGGSVCLDNVLEHIQNHETTHCEHCGQALEWNRE